MPLEQKQLRLPTRLRKHRKQNMNDDIEIVTGDAPTATGDDYPADDDRSDAEMQAAEIELCRQKADALAKTLDAECVAIIDSAQTRMREEGERFLRRVHEIEEQSTAAFRSLSVRVDDLRAKIESLRRGG